MHYTKLRTQGDFKQRVVTLANLLAMCEAGSGITHMFYPAGDASEHRVSVGYSNPDEYGHDAPVFFYLPSWPNPFERENPYVALTVTHSTGGRDTFDKEAAFQSFDAAVLSADELFRSGEYTSDWNTREEWDEMRAASEEMDATADEQIRQGAEIDSAAE